MIEIRKHEDSESEDVYQLFIDGMLLDKVEIQSFDDVSDGSRTYSIRAYDRKAGETITKYSLSDMPHVDYIALRYEFDWLSSIDRILIIREPNTDTEQNETENEILSYKVNLWFGRFSQWRKIYSFADYFDELSRIVASKEEINISFWPTGHIPEHIDRPYIISLGSLSAELPIADELSRLSDILRGLNEEVESSLAARHYSGSVTLSLDLPEDVRVPCEQYLLYFVQFLKDIGIEATAELRHDASAVLFSVTPKDKSEALNHIRHALEVYLTLPTNPNLNATFGLTADLRTQQLVANIQHLQGQLVLANAVMQLKDATIQQQQVTIQQQRQVTGEILIESVKIDAADEESQDKEKILGGTVAITKFKWKFLEFDTPDIWRRIKQFVFESDES